MIGLIPTILSEAINRISEIIHPQSINEFYKVGTIQQSGSIQKFEFALSRSKIKGLTGKALKIGVQVAANDWSAIIGYSPDQGSDPFFLDMSE
jgi:hypothetical protein